MIYGQFQLTFQFLQIRSWTSLHHQTKTMALFSASVLALNFRWQLAIFFYCYIRLLVSRFTTHLEDNWTNTHSGSRHGQFSLTLTNSVCHLWKVLLLPVFFAHWWSCMIRAHEWLTSLGAYIWIICSAKGAQILSVASILPWAAQTFHWISSLCDMFFLWHRITN